jgi:putative (di)nucleoside polyphosphate hydrolase
VTIKPLRRNAGIALFNRSGQVLLARRIESDGSETIAPGFEWQMPQGGIDDGEEPLTAARRELREETGVSHAGYLGETDWISYNFPPYDGPDHSLSKYRGQIQKWFAFRFEGDDRDIDVCTAPDGQKPEFDQWRWERLSVAVNLVVPFKRHIYENVAQSFVAFAR